MKCLSVFFMLFTLSVSVVAQVENDKKTILKILDEQRLAWNNGDIESYMRGYWKSDSLRFVGKSGVRYGWNETLASYKKGYPSKKEMGQLSFNVISLEFLSKNSAFMIGKWSISRDENNISGHFMLIWKKIDGNWLITADHSS